MASRFFLLGLLVLATGCGGGGQRVRLAIPLGLDPFPIYVAEALGLFRAERVEVTIDALPGSKGLEALIGGSADVRYSGAIEVLQAGITGKRLKSFFVAQRTVYAMLVASAGKAERIRRVEDLKGSVVGVSTFGSSQHVLLNFILSKHGLGPGDVTLIAHGNGASAIASLEHGKEDAGTLDGSAYAVLRRRAPGVRVLLDPRTREATRELFDSADYASFSLLATTEWLDRHPDVARRMVRAMKRALEWIRERSVEEVLAKLPEHLRSADGEPDLESLRVIIGGLSEDGRMPPGGPEVLRQLGGVSMERLREHGIELSQTYTNEFVEGAHND